MSLDERFWSKVQIGKRYECWNWTGAKLKGYGLYRRLGRLNRAHRYSFEQFHGPIPSRLHCLHKCDNPSCVNPSHLFLGTHQDNMTDRERKGRGKRCRGETHGNHKLNSRLVVEIIKRYRAGNVSQRKLALEYGVVQCTIRSILIGKTWSKI